MLFLELPPSCLSSNPSQVSNLLAKSNPPIREVHKNLHSRCRNPTLKKAISLYPPGRLTIGGRLPHTNFCTSPTSTETLDPLRVQKKYSCVLRHLICRYPKHFQDACRSAVSVIFSLLATMRAYQGSRGSRKPTLLLGRRKAHGYKYSNSRRGTSNILQGGDK